MEVVDVFSALHKRGVGGEVRIWYMERGCGGLGEGHRVVSGVLRGAETRSGWTVCEPKNVGRSNETTARQQAELEIAAEYKKKRDRGYFDKIEDIDKVPFTKPMLAAEWTKRRAKIDISAGVHVQPKLDGIRCIARADGLWTRTGKKIVACPHIEEALAPHFAADPDLILDGELYNHTLKEDFNTITSIVRKSKLSEADIDKATALIEYHVYDMVSEEAFATRASAAARIVEDTSDPAIQFVETLYAQDQELLDELYGEWLELGYEGQIIRLSGPYEHKRSNLLIKRKEFLSDEFPVVAVHEGEGNWRGYVKRFTFRLPDGRECGAGVRGTQAALRALLERGASPDWATVRYFTPTPDGFPRFPVVTDWGWGVRGD